MIREHLQGGGRETEAGGEKKLQSGESCQSKSGGRGESGRAGGRGRCQSAGGEGGGGAGVEGEEWKGDLLNDLFIFSAFVFLSLPPSFHPSALPPPLPPSIAPSLVLVTKISPVPTWYVTVRSTVTV